MDVQEIISKVAKLENYIAKNDGVRSHVSEELKKLSIDSIEDAESTMAKLTASITLSDGQLTNIGERLNNITAWDSV